MIPCQKNQIARYCVDRKFIVQYETLINKISQSESDRARRKISQKAVKGQIFGTMRELEQLRNVQITFKQSQDSQSMLHSGYHKEQVTVDAMPRPFPRPHARQAPQYRHILTCNDCFIFFPSHVLLEILSFFLTRLLKILLRLFSIRRCFHLVVVSSIKAGDGLRIVYRPLC